MSAYVSTARSIKDALVTILGQIQLDAGSGPEAAFALVTDDPSAAFNQEPFCLVMPAKSDDVKAAVGVQDRTVAFTVIIVLSLENGQRTQPQTYDYMYDLVELTLDSLDNADWADTLNTLGVNLDTWFLNATKNEIVIGESKGAAILIGTIDVAVSYSYYPTR